MKKWTRRNIVKDLPIAFGLAAIAGQNIFSPNEATAGPEVKSVKAPTPALEADSVSNGRWSLDRINSWYAKFPWIVGCNYVPSTAVNQLETWQAETFDPKTIDRELGMAESLGFNAVRVFLHDLAWKQDPSGFKKRLKAFHDLCEKHRIWTIPTFFTNGGPGIPIKIGKQPAPQLGVHNSQWLQSPGADTVNDPKKWGYLEDYVSDILTEFAKNNRVFTWCLYNEPENTRHGGYALPLMRRVWQWGRKVAPSQPFTAPITVFPGEAKNFSNFPTCCFLGENCDLISFHCYRKPEEVVRLINLLKDFNRPLICTEYLDRPHNNFFNVTPIFKEHKIGAIHFGLVNGKCNFHFHTPKELPEPKNWKHDIFRQDGSPFDQEEVDFIKKLTGAAK